MAAGEQSIQIVERDGNVVRMIGHGPEGSIEVIASMTLQGDRLILTDLHADGAGPGSIGLAAIRSFGRLLCRQAGAKIVEIYGARRATGARPGKVPRPVTIRLEE
jgi:hypothetical protein